MSPIFDYHGSLARMGNDESLLREMASLIAEDGPYRLREALAGLQERDAIRTSHAAHTLKGLAANFGAMRAVAAAAKLEDLSRRENWTEAQTVGPNLQAAFQELLQELRPLASVNESA